MDKLLQTLYMDVSYFGLHFNNYPVFQVSRRKGDTLTAGLVNKNYPFKIGAWKEIIAGFGPIQSITCTEIVAALVLGCHFQHANRENLCH